jgi:hypothetical protein
VSASFTKEHIPGFEIRLTPELSTLVLARQKKQAEALQRRKQQERMEHACQLQKGLAITRTRPSLKTPHPPMTKVPPGAKRLVGLYGPAKERVGAKLDCHA